MKAKRSLREKLENNDEMMTKGRNPYWRNENFINISYHLITISGNLEQIWFYHFRPIFFRYPIYLLFFWGAGRKKLIRNKKNIVFPNCLKWSENCSKIIFDSPFKQKKIWKSSRCLSSSSRRGSPVSPSDFSLPLFFAFIRYLQQSWQEGKR